MLIKMILASINLPIMGYIPVACVLTDPVLKMLLSYLETMSVLLLLVVTWMYAHSRRKDRVGMFTKRDPRAEYILSLLFSCVFTFGLRASTTLFARHDEDPTQQLISRAVASLLPLFMLFLICHFRRLLQEHRAAVKAMAGAKASEDIKLRVALKKRKRCAEEAARYLIERFNGDDDDEATGRRGCIPRSHWQLMIWARQGVLFLTSLSMDLFVWFAQPQLTQITRYSFAGVAVAVLVFFLCLHHRRQPYILRRQHYLEAGLYLIDMIAIAAACVYGVLTDDGRIQDAPGRATLEVFLGALMATSVIVAVIIIAWDVARDQRLVKEWYMKYGLMQAMDGLTVEAKKIIDAPVENAIRDGAVHIIDCSWLMDTERSDKQLPRLTKVIAHLSTSSAGMSIHQKRQLIRLLAEKCDVSAICITIDDSGSSTLHPPVAQLRRSRTGGFASGHFAAAGLRRSSSSHSAKFVEVTFHLSTLQEVAPLTSERLSRKADDVKSRLLSIDHDDEFLRGLLSNAVQMVGAEVVVGNVFLPRCQDMPKDAFLDPKAAADIYAKGERNSKPSAEPSPCLAHEAYCVSADFASFALSRAVFVLSYCWQLDGVPDPDGRVLEKIRGRLENVKRQKQLQSFDAHGLFVDAACLPQAFAVPSWHKLPALVERFGAERLTPEQDLRGPLTVLKFDWDGVDPIDDEDEATICMDRIRDVCDGEGWSLACLAEFRSSGLQPDSMGVPRVLFHERFISGTSRFDKSGPSVGYMRFRAPEHAKRARQNAKLLQMFGGRVPELMGESVLANELNFKRGLSVMGSLYASPVGTAVLQVTMPPDEYSKDDLGLISNRTGTVFVLKVPDEAKAAAADDRKSRDVLPYEVMQANEALRRHVLTRRDVLAYVDLLDAPDWTARMVVRFDGDGPAQAASTLEESAYPLRDVRMFRKVSGKTAGFFHALCSCIGSRKVPPTVFPSYNARPYLLRGWPIFETAAASMVLAHIWQRRGQRGRSLPHAVQRAETFAPKLVNIDSPDAPDVKAVQKPPEYFLRECKKKLRSETQAKFTGGSDRPKVLQVLADFEDSIATEFDAKRVDHIFRAKVGTETADLAMAREARKEEEKNALKVKIHQARLGRLDLSLSKLWKRQFPSVVLLEVERVAVVPPLPNEPSYRAPYESARRHVHVAHVSKPSEEQQKGSWQSKRRQQQKPIRSSNAARPNHTSPATMTLAESRPQKGTQCQARI